jgi:putative transposase
MTRWSILSALLLHCSQFCFGQQPAKNGEAAVIGLRGPVHSVLTENFNYRDNSQGKPTESALAIYDPEGYLLEEYHYEPGGALRLHTKYTRKGWQVFKTETTSAIPSEDRTFVQSFNSAGLVTGTETYDGSGSRDLLPKIRTRLSMISYLRKGEFMSRSNHTEAQMIGALKQLEAGRKAEDVAREVGVSKHTIYAWKAKYGGMDVSEAQEAKQLRDENTRLKKLVVDLSLDKEMLKAIIAKNGWSS